MRTWGVGVFDNVVATEWASDFDETAPERRGAVVRAALTELPGGDNRVAGLAAVAAATTLASLLPGGRLLGSSYGPKTLEENLFEIDEDLADLALRAMEALMSPDSEWSARWNESGLLDDAVAVVEAVIDELELRSDFATAGEALAS